MTLSASPPQPKTSRGRLLPEARHLVLPDGIVSSGFPPVRETCRRIGIEFDRWQQDLNTAILAKGADGLLAADTVAMSICRQAGKTFDVGALVFADSIINPGTTSVWTAHRFKVARESFDSLRALARSPLLAPHIDYEEITTAAGNETIPFRNGSRVVFAARERGTIRGFSRVRRLILDEGQILTESAMSDLAPTMNQAFDPQIIIMGTPPKPTDPGEFFSNLRDDAIGGTSGGTLYVELAADPDCDLDDRAAWAQANLSYPRRTPEKAILRLRKLLSEDDFAREALGIWAPKGSDAVIDFVLWESLADGLSQPRDGYVFALDATPDRTAASIGMAGRRADGVAHVEVVDNRKGVNWLVDRAKELQGRWSAPIFLDDAGPVGSLLPALDAAGVIYRKLSAREFGQACGAFYDAVSGGGLRHIGQPLLNSALGAARRRPLGDAWAWHRRDRTDISPLVAVTNAHYGLLRSAVPPAGKLTRVSGRVRSY